MPCFSKSQDFNFSLKILTFSLKLSIHFFQDLKHLYRKVFSQVLAFHISMLAFFKGIN